MIPRIDVCGTSYWLKELTIGQALDIAKLPEKLNETRITCFLKHVQSVKDPLVMTVQERYSLLIQYLAATQQDFAGVSCDYETYLNFPALAWVDEIAIDGGKTLGQLTGLQAEVLEALCEDSADWLMGVMVMQMNLPDWEPVALSERQLVQDGFMKRYERFKRLGITEADALYQEWNQYRWKLDCLVRLAVDDNGFVIYGGADDAPARFCPAASFGRLVTDLAECASWSRGDTSPVRADDSSGSDESAFVDDWSV